MNEKGGDFIRVRKRVSKCERGIVECFDGDSDHFWISGQIKLRLETTNFTRLGLIGFLFGILGVWKTLGKEIGKGCCGEGSLLDWWEARKKVDKDKKKKVNSGGRG